MRNLDVAIADATRATLIPNPADVSVEPRGEKGVRCKTVRIAREADESGLSDFLGMLCRADLAQCGGKDQIEMAADDFRKRLLGVVPGVAREQDFTCTFS